MQKEITLDKLVRWGGAILLVFAALYLVGYLSAVLLPFFVAWLFAYLLFPVVKFVEDKLRVKLRAVAILVTLLALLVVIGGIAWLIIPPMLDQFKLLVKILNNWLQQSADANNIASWIQQRINENRETIEEFLRGKDFRDLLRNATPKVFSIVGQTASVLLSVVASLITILYMFFILLDYEYLTNNWIKIFPRRNRPFWQELMVDVERELNNYIRGQGLVSLCLGILFCIGFTIIDFPMAIGLGVIIGFLNLVPYLHTLAIIPTAFLAMLKAADTGQNFWWVFGLAMAVFVICQLISDTVLTPKILGKAMRLNPAILLLSLSVWGALLGFIGLIVALPLTTLLIAYWKRYVTREEDAAPIVKHHVDHET